MSDVFQYGIPPPAGRLDLEYSNRLCLDHQMQGTAHMMYLNKRIPVNRHQHLFLHAVRKQTSAFPVDDRLALCSQWTQRPGHRLQTLSVT